MHETKKDYHAKKRIIYIEIFTWRNELFNFEFLPRPDHTNGSLVDAAAVVGR